MIRLGSFIRSSSLARIYAGQQSLSVFRALMTRPTKVPVLSEQIFVWSPFGQFETLERNTGEYLWKKYDREFSPWTWIGTTHPYDPRKGFQVRPTSAIVHPFLVKSLLLSTVKAPSKMPSNLLQPRNGFVASKRISVFSEADGVSKEARLVREGRVGKWQPVETRFMPAAWVEE